MPIPDIEGNQQFKKDVDKGLSIKELSEKYGIKPRQVIRLKKKLRERDDRMKRVAARQKRTPSAILREILKQHLKNK